MFFYLCCITVLLLRAFDVQILRDGFYKKQGDARQLREVSVPAHRGDILDRNGEPLAISTPVESVWINPKQALQTPERLSELAAVLEMKSSRLLKRVQSQGHREFLYLRRHVSPELAAQVRELSVPGVALQQEYKRYYPNGEVIANIIGFADIDDNGQEGIELAYNSWLKGKDGKKTVIRDRLGRAFDDIQRNHPNRRQIRQISG